MNGIELIQKIKEHSLKEILESGKTNSETGNLFEKIWDIVIKFGFCTSFPNNIYEHYKGNINTTNLKKVDNLELYLKKLSVFSKGDGGSSDITLRNTHTDRWVFISSKYYLDDSKKHIDDYDVQNILAVTKEHSYIYKEYDIYLLVKNKEKVQKIISSCQKTNNYIKENISKILDENDLEIFFRKLKDTIQYINFDNINNIFCNTKIPLHLRFHQELISSKIMKKVNEDEKQFLIGAKPRSGKTYCIGGIFTKYFRKFKRINALIITPVPNETISQFTNDLFHKFIDFIGINIVEIKSGINFQSLKLEENNIIITSKQLLDGYLLDKKVHILQRLNLDFIIFDENHFGGTSELSRNILNTYSSQKTNRIYLTATYSKPLYTFDIPENCRFYWDIEDEQMCKKRDIEGIIKKHGNVSDILNKENSDYILKPYDNMPDLHLLTNIMDNERYLDIKGKIKDTCYGFSNTTLLSGNFPNEVDMILRYITGSEKEIDYKEGDKSFFGRIRQQSIKYDSRTKLNNGDFTTQLWFLSYGIGMTIDKVSEHLKERMLKNKTLKRYEIKIVNSKEEYKVRDIKEQIKQWEIKAKHDEKDGLILLAGNQLTLGITLPLVDIVFLFNDVQSSDKIFQMMYRSMTEKIDCKDYNTINNGKKKFGFVVDLNISRVLNTVLEYNVYKKDLNIEEKIAYIVENNLINIDSDLFNSKENRQKLVEKLLGVWKSNPINSLEILSRKIKECNIVLERDDQKEINKYFTSSINDKINIKVKVDEENDQSLPTGRTVSNKSNEEKKEKIVEEKDISLTKDVLPFIIPLCCILTLKSPCKDILEMLNNIEDDSTLLEIFNEQCKIWWNKKQILKMIITLISKYIIKESPIYDITIQMKLSLKNLIDKPKELLEYINTCLKPKEEEKKKFGEVFTPMKLVNEMLDKLPVEVWGNKDLKWFDPAAGMGNFQIAVYLRLMEGLKLEIPDDNIRKRHILENMLYMSELNTKNVFVCKQIFDADNNYNLNLYEGDTLKLNVDEEWGINKFDIIIGNPPYQKNFKNNNNRVGGSSLWSEFINYSTVILKEDGYLLFITPCSWMTGGSNKQSGNILKGVMQKYTLLHLNIEECAKHFNVASTFSYYLLKKTLLEINFDCICQYKKNIYKSSISNSMFRKLSVVPKLFTNEMISIIDKIENASCDKFNFQRLRDLDSSAQTKRYSTTGKYKVRHKVVDIRYTDWQQECMNRDKIVISMPGYIKATYDKECGCSDATLFMYVENPTEGIRLINLLNSDIYQIIINSYRELTGLNNHKNINRLSIVDINDLEVTNEENNIIYKLSSNEKQIPLLHSSKTSSTILVPENFNKNETPLFHELNSLKILESRQMHKVENILETKGCLYQFTKGKKAGQNCNVKPKNGNTYCSTHTKKENNEITCNSLYDNIAISINNTVEEFILKIIKKYPNVEYDVLKKLWSDFES